MTQPIDPSAGREPAHEPPLNADLIEVFEQYRKMLEVRSPDSQWPGPLGALTLPLEAVHRLLAALRVWPPPADKLGVIQSCVERMATAMGAPMSCYYCTVTIESNAMVSHEPNCPFALLEDVIAGTSAGVPPPAAATEEVVIDHIEAHWFTQGGAAQFAPLNLPAKNADGIISAILAAVRKSLPPAAETPTESLMDAVIEQAQTWRETGDNYSAIQFERAAATLEGIARRFGARVDIFGKVSAPAPALAPETPDRKQETT